MFMFVITKVRDGETQFMATDIFKIYSCFNFGIKCDFIYKHEELLLYLLEEVITISIRYSKNRIVIDRQQNPI